LEHSQNLAADHQATICLCPSCGIGTCTTAFPFAAAGHADGEREQCGIKLASLTLFLFFSGTVGVGFSPPFHHAEISFSSAAQLSLQRKFERRQWRRSDR